MLFRPVFQYFPIHPVLQLPPQFVFVHCAKHAHLLDECVRYLVLPTLQRHKSVEFLLFYENHFSPSNIPTLIIQRSLLEVTFVGSYVSSRLFVFQRSIHFDFLKVHEDGGNL